MIQSKAIGFVKVRCGLATCSGGTELTIAEQLEWYSCSLCRAERGCLGLYSDATFTSTMRHIPVSQCESQLIICTCTCASPLYIHHSPRLMTCSVSEHGCVLCHHMLLLGVYPFIPQLSHSYHSAKLLNPILRPRAATKIQFKPIQTEIQSIQPIVYTHPSTHIPILLIVSGSSLIQDR